MHLQGIHGSHTTTASAMSADAGHDGADAPTDTGAEIGNDRAGQHDSGGAPVGAAPGTTASGTTTSGTAEPARTNAAAGSGKGAAPRSTPLRVDAQRNLEHVLRAAREVFGELGYGAPMEDVARRARVGVGTVYRRFPSKEVLVQRIAAEETARLTEQARTALSEEEEPWAALARFLRTSVASGAGRLLPPKILRADGWNDEIPPGGTVQLPHQRQSEADSDGAQPRNGQPDLRLVSDSDAQQAAEQTEPAQTAAAASAPPAPPADQLGGVQEDPGTAELLSMVGQLVQRARDVGELRTDVTVGDVLLLIATAAPSLPDAAQQAAASKRLLDILLEGLRPRPHT